MTRKKLPYRPYIINKGLLKYKQHVFFCTNEHDSGKPCCANRNAKKHWRYAKDKIKEMGLHEKSKIRINKAGCMGFCDSGPVLVVYPDGVFYRYVDTDDIDEILEIHVLGGELVQRLLLNGQ